MSASARPKPLQDWHHIVQQRDWQALEALLDEHAVFHSPVVHTPQRGRLIVATYLRAASRVLLDSGFRYVREIASDTDALLEFEAELDGIHVNGVDLIRWNPEGRIVDFKVMVRPLKAVHKLHEVMAAQLQAMQEPK